MTRTVSQTAWQHAIDAIRVKEKEQMRRQDALNAERRRLPRVKIEKHYEFTDATGKHSLLDLFAGRTQLIVYHFMYGPDMQAPCTGCSMMVDNMCHIAHLHARDTSLVLVARSPYPRLAEVQQRMGWQIPWYSSDGSDFNFDFDVSSDDGEKFGISVFIRHGEDIYRTYFTSKRGAEYLGSIFTYLDLTPRGRQELWEDSPDNVPQTPPYQWWRKHEEY
jgi:predicted dithiol-disulfide oxidoreductase (DUF899 family)